MKWGFLGIGRVTDRMATLINGMQNHKLVIASARDEEKLETWSRKYSPERTSTSLELVCKDPSLDAIYVALPPSLHAIYAIKALQSGKNVLCEKPLAARHDECLAMQSCSIETGKPLFHATSFPYHPRSLKMRETIRSGALGKLKRITIACSASHILTRGNDHRLSAESGGGCLLDLGWYCVYATLWFTGLRPHRIAAFGTQDPTTGIWVSAQALVQLHDGAVAHWDCGFDAAGRKWIEFAGSDASMICDDFLRPWDTQKPRYWIHGHDGKATCETVVSEFTQEEHMLSQMSHATNTESNASLELAVETQRILGEWERQLVDGCDSL